LSHAAETRFKLEDALNGMQARRLLARRVGQNVERQPDADARSGDDAMSEQTYRCVRFPVSEFEYSTDFSAAD
jgi:hypothetical protein